MRSKETEADYRYIREPDLLPIRLSETQKTEILSNLPELPLERRQRFIEVYGLPEYDADILTDERGLSDYFEQAIRAYGSDPKRVSNWLMNDVMRMMNTRGVLASELRLNPDYLARIIKLVDTGVLNTSTGKSLLEKVEESGIAPEEIIESEGLGQVSDHDAIRSACSQVLTENPDQVESYHSGKTTLIGWFVGQVMRKTGGKVDPQLTRELLLELLDKNQLIPAR
jgi:aspartyl-tRNA(Asn)/glutamyl-tRNA(Gln) amidotransferase subunit B